VPQTDEQQTQPQVELAYVARTRLKVGDSYRQPGELVPEATDWPNLQLHVDNGQLEEVPMINGQVPQRQERPAQTFAPADYDQRTPTPAPPIGQRHPAPGHQELSCVNCRVTAGETLNYVPQDAARFECWLCQQQQSVHDALGYPPQSWDDVQRAGFKPGPR
jgi:hypothetical protein